MELLRAMREFYAYDNIFHSIQYFAFYYDWRFYFLNLQFQN